MNVVQRASLVVGVLFGLSPSTLPLALGANGSSPAFEWQTASPESQGVSSSRLDALREELKRRNTDAFLVIRNDKIVYEWYGAGNGPDKPHGTASLAKAIYGGMSLGVAVNDGKISLDDRAAKYVPSWESDPLKSKILIRHLGSHTSGLADASARGVKHEDLPSWMGDFWKRLPPPNDPFTIARDLTPMRSPPGERIRYSNPGIGMLGYCVTAAIKDTPQKDIRTLLRERVMRPIGIRDEDWSAGYGQTPVVDGLPLVACWGGGSISARALARLGRLVLRDGDWDGQRILSASAVHQVTQDAGMPGGCGMGWWTNGRGRYKKTPKDAVWGAGAGDQVLVVVPSLELIMVRNGQALHSAEDIAKLKTEDVFENYHDPRERTLYQPLFEAVMAAPDSKQGP